MMPGSAAVDTLGHFVGFGSEPWIDDSLSTGVRCSTPRRCRCGGNFTLRIQGSCVKSLAKFVVAVVVEVVVEGKSGLRDCSPPI